MKILFLNYIDESGAGKACLKIIESLKKKKIKKKKFFLQKI